MTIEVLFAEVCNLCGDAQNAEYLRQTLPDAELIFTPLKDPTVDCIIFAGKRCKDHVLRAAMSGVDISKIITTDEVKNCSALVDTQKYQDIYLLFENYWLDEALAEEKKLAERGESGT